MRPSLAHPRTGAAPSRSRRFAMTAGLALVVGLATAWMLLRTGAPAPLPAAALLHAREAVLQHQLELGSDEGRLYLVLEPDRGTLTLWQGPAPLRSWPVAAVSSGERRISVGGGPEREAWRSVLWEGARLDPPVRRERRVLVSDQVEPPDLTGSVEWVPPTPEEEVPTPERFTVHFAGGLGLEVRALGADTLAYRPGLDLRARAALAHLKPENWDRYRIRIVMDAAAAGSLYRGLPEGAAFLAVLPEEPSAPPTEADAGSPR